MVVVVVVVAVAVVVVVARVDATAVVVVALVVAEVGEMWLILSISRLGPQDFPLKGQSNTIFQTEIKKFDIVKSLDKSLEKGTSMENL